MLSFPGISLDSGERYLGFVHTKRYIDKCKFCCDHYIKFGGIPSSLEAFETACFAVGASILASETGGYAIVRLPGHHAAPDLPDDKIGLGYCFCNDMAIATEFLISEGKRILVFGFDLHHGNGIQESLIGLENIVYLSTHQKNIWPWTGATTLVKYFS